MSDLSRTIAAQLLAEAEERFLQENDWEKVAEATAPSTVTRGQESLWTYRGTFKPRRKSNWNRIDRSHAVHAAKLVIKQRYFKDESHPNYNKDDRERINYDD